MPATWDDRFRNVAVMAMFLVDGDKFQVIVDCFSDLVEWYNRDDEIAEVVMISNSEPFFGRFSGLSGTVRTHELNSLKEGMSFLRSKLT